MNKKGQCTESVILIVTFVLASFGALAQTFDIGSQFIATDYYGQVNVSCPQLFRPRNLFCQQSVLQPSSYGIFMGPNITADTVTLVSDQGKIDGTTVSQELDYIDGQSNVAFNLWTSTLFQTPLLGPGTNHLQYSLTSQGSVVQQGAWIVQVNVGPAQNCAIAAVSGDAGTVCDDPFTSCQTYFQTASCTAAIATLKK